MIAPSRRALLLGLWGEGAHEPPEASVAWIRPDRCLARTGCATCVERCPTPGAIRWQDGAPVVVPQVCDSCGVCVALCPAPTPAIALVARRAHEHAPAA